MSDNNKTEEHHPFFGIWAEEEETGKKAFVIRCGCGETIYYLEKDLFSEPDRIFPGMTIDEFQKMHRQYQKLKGMKRQIQRVALAQHAENYKDCPAIAKLKENAGVTSVNELPNPFERSL